MTLNDWQPLVQSLQPWQLRIMIEAIATGQTESLQNACETALIQDSSGEMPNDLAPLETIAQLRQQLAEERHHRIQAERSAQEWQQKCLKAVRAWRRHV